MSWGSQEYMSKLKKGCKFLNQAAQSVTCIPLPTEFNAFMEDIPGYPYGVYVDNFIFIIYFNYNQPLSKAIVYRRLHN